MFRINAINTQNKDTKKAKQNKPIQRVNTQSNRLESDVLQGQQIQDKFKYSASYKLKSWPLSQGLKRRCLQGLTNGKVYKIIESGPLRSWTPGAHIKAFTFHFSKFQFPLRDS